VPGWIDIVVFDLDGTLVDTAPDLIGALNHALLKLGRAQVRPELVRHLAGDGARALIRRGLELTGGITDALVEEGVLTFLEHYEAHLCDHSTRAEHIEDALDALADADIRIGICTNKPERLARKLVLALGWQPRFGSIIGGDTVGASKPDPRPLLACIEECGGGRAVFIGDTLSDRETAHAAGVTFIGAAVGCGGAAFTSGEDYPVIASFAELLSDLGRLARPQ
jgi:phosphoglycolate phosphatase